MVKLKKNKAGRYIDANTGKFLPKSVYQPIIEAKSKAGKKGAAIRYNKTPTKSTFGKKHQEIKDIKDTYNVSTKVAVQVNRDLNTSRIQRALSTTARRYNMSIEETKERYADFITKYRADPEFDNWAEVMYPK
jgi:hypothetical protein